MTQGHFQCQFNRASEVWGRNAYPKERLQVIWRSMEHLPDPWLTHTMDYFIGHSKFAPLMAEFSEEISKYREYNWSVEKKQYAEDAKQWASTYHFEEMSSICENIRKRIKGEMTDEEFECFTKVLASPQVQCDRCLDDGVYFDKGKGGMYLCSCKPRSR